jgi:signal transduction histidine kinase
MGSRGRSIRLRIYFLVAVPLVTMVGLLGYVSYSTVTNAIDIDRGPNLIHATSVPAAQFIALLQSERRTAVVYIFEPTAANLAVYRRAVKTTQAGLPTFEQQMTSNATLSSASQDEITLIHKIVNQVTAPAGTPGALATLRIGVEARLIAPGKPMTALDALKAYDQGSAAMLQLFLTEAASVTDNTQATQTLGLINTVASRDFLSQEDALLAGMLAARRIPPADRAAFSQLAGERAAYMESATAMLSQANYQVFNQFLNRDAQLQTELAGIEGAIGAGVPISQLPVTLDSWQALTSKLLIDDFNGSTTTADAELAQSAKIAHAAWWRFGISSGAGLIGLLLTIILTSLTGRAIIRRLRRLETSALTLAENQLPDVIARLRRGDDVDVAVEAPPLRVGNDEIGRVGQAFDLVRQTAVRAAVEEAKLRRGLNDVFRSLARRSQSLLHRQLTLLDQMERRATDPEALDDLFRLDHLTTRMRRHAEGLIILAGAPAGRGWSSPVRMVDVMRGAIAEVEDYARVSVVSRSQAALAGSAVADVIHLLAELIENATTLSPPYTTVRVSGETVPNGFAIEVEDRGLGVSQHRLAELNDRLANPPEFNPSDSEQLGLFVVSQLAKRHGIKVTLKASPYGGTEAVVLVPRQLVVGDEAYRVGLPGGSAQIVAGTLAGNGDHPVSAGELSSGPPFGSAPMPDSPADGGPMADAGQFPGGPRISGPMRRSRGEFADSAPQGSHHAPRREKKGNGRNGSANGKGNGFGTSAPFPASPSGASPFPGSPFPGSPFPASPFPGPPADAPPADAAPAGTSPFGASPFGGSPGGGSPGGGSPGGGSPGGGSPGGGSPFGAEPFAAGPPGANRLPEVPGAFRVPDSADGAEPGELPRRNRGQAPGPARAASLPAAADSFDVFKPTRHGGTEPAGPGEMVAGLTGPAVEAPGTRAQTGAPYAEPADGFGAADGDLDGLPKRVRQASLAPQLRGDPAFRQRQAEAAAGRGAGSPAGGGPSPDEIRATMSALQRGLQEGRSQYAAEGEPPWQTATEGGSDGS